MYLVHRTVGLLGLAVAFAITAEPSHAELTADQKKHVAAVTAMIREAGARYQANDFQASGERLEAAMTAIDALIEAEGAEVYDALTPNFPVIIDAHIRLE